MRRIAVVMAGGSGERFWPLSRTSRPKQLLRLTHPERNMLQEAVARIADVVGPDNVFVATSESLKGPIAKAELVPPARLFAEPLKRNTLGALSWATSNLIAYFPKDWQELSVAVVTADHKIGDQDRFEASVSSALELAESSRGLVTIGIPPTRPETGYGYIEIVEAGIVAEAGPRTYRAASFTEKPDATRAQEYWRSGRYLWNSGMFFWKLGSFFQALDLLLPEIAEVVLQVAQFLTAQQFDAAAERFSQIPDLSIDYAVMERAENVFVVQADFPWDDLGAYGALERALPADEAGNIISGEVLGIDTTGSILLNDSKQMITCVLGMSDVVVVTTEDAVLVCPKSRAQEVRRVVDALKERRPQAL